MKTVRIYGSAPNLALAPKDYPPGIEIWCFNDPRRGHRQSRACVWEEWTRWFNLHSERHMRATYPAGYVWYQAQRDEPYRHLRNRPDLPERRVWVAHKRIVLQKVHKDIPLSEAFPRDEVMAHFNTRYFTFSTAWALAYAAMERFEKIELYGFMISSAKEKYWLERPCFYYWVDRLRKAGVVIEYPKIIDTGGSTEIGDPETYTGPLYGYETT